MDDKNLKPEFKEIYERVMNTPIKSSPETTKQETPPPAPSQPASAEQKIEQTTVQPNQQEQFLSSVPPRPINDAGSTPFIFSSKDKHNTPTDQNAESANSSQQTVAHTAKKKSISPVIFVLIFVFIVAYAVFWLIFFGVISIF